jgi:mono/diheme cytochrome c family protein
LSAFAASAFAVRTDSVVSQEKPAERRFATLAESKAEFERVVAPFLKVHCASCHGPKVQEGELGFHELEMDMKASTSAGRWAMVIEKLVTREMPPEGRARPGDDEIKAVVSWIQTEMKRSGKNFARRHAIANGNKVPHDKLFDPKTAYPFNNPGRLRTLSPEIYTGFSTDLAKGLSLGQPFTPEGRTTFKDMGAPKIDEPVTVQLMRNALLIVERQTLHKVESGKLVAGPGAVKEMLPFVDENVPLTPVLMEKAIALQFQKVLSRPPTLEEKARLLKLMEKNVLEAGRVTGMRYALSAVYLMPEAIYRFEVGTGKPDEQGRVRLAPREIAYALAYALTDKRPDAKLLADAIEGKLDTKEGVAAAARSLLDDAKTPKPRIMRFFREYFGYDKAKEVFQEDKANPDHDARILVEDTDRLIEYILEQDRDVLRELLTTNKAFVAYKTAADTKRKRQQEIAKFEEGKKKDPAKYTNKTLKLPGRSVYRAYNLDDFPDTQPVDLPAEQRAGILTQPSWLAANAKTDENHAIFRGKWVRERLLGGVVPDVPITVDAQLPEAPDKPLRERMKVTEQEYCWKCHQLMNPIGLPFEMYDYFGRYRDKEPLVDLAATAKNVDKKGKVLDKVMHAVPVDARGSITFASNSALEGDVKNAVEMLHKLANSERVEQVFVRHAFRYWLGRNENLGDGPSLRQAHQAYRDNGGSMKALIASLLSSDSFLYRTPSGEEKK